MILFLTLIVSVGMAENSISSKKNRKAKLDVAEASAPLYRDPIFDGAADPTVVYFSKDKEWRMYYTQRRANAAFEGVAFCYGSAIGIAKSKDNGKTWSYAGIAKLPQPDSGHNTFWAPQVIFNAKTKLYHMFVTYIKGIFSNWGGERQIFHYTSKDLSDWKFEKPIGTKGCIDASVIQLNNGTWKMWYKDEARGSHTLSALSDDLFNWEINNTSEVAGNAHEGPVVFYWKNKYWMLTDKWNGLDCYESDDASKWKKNNSILDKVGHRIDDNDIGRHAEVKVIDDRAYIFYFTHPGRIYKDGKSVSEQGQIRFQRSSIQFAELELKNGKVICDRDKYKFKNPHEQKNN